MELTEYIKKLFTRAAVQTDKRKYRGGINSESAELRDKIATLIQKDFKQVAGLTSGWTNYTLLRSYEDAIAWKKNPAACWWVIYKKNKALHGRKPKTGVRAMGKKGRKKDPKVARQNSLFDSGETRSKSPMGEGKK